MKRKLTIALALCLGLLFVIPLALSALPAASAEEQIADLLKEEGEVTVLESYPHGGDSLILFRTDSGQLGLATARGGEDSKVSWARTTDKLLERYEGFWAEPVLLNEGTYQIFLCDNQEVAVVEWETQEGEVSIHPFLPDKRPDLLVIPTEGNSRYTYYALDGEGNRLHG